jgi:predicted transcriptional regulator of viral defense system
MMVSAVVGRGAGISQRNRAYLETLHRQSTGAFGVAEASRLLGLASEQTGRLLVYLARRGWLARVRRGLYVAVPLDARRSGEWIEDSWVVAERLFSPCYIGGWSACEHWDLTEQTFRTLLVVTSRRVRERDITIQGIPFHLTVRQRTAFFGTAPVWRGRNRVSVSDPSRTIIDLLDDPQLGGGVRSTADALNEYLGGAHRNDKLLIEYAERLGNGAVFKRLGYLLEQAGVDAGELVQACFENRTSGLASLDPSMKGRGRIVRRWRLRVNVPAGTHGGGK